MSSNIKKLSEKIIKSLKELGYIERVELNKFIGLEREQGKEVIKYLIELEESPLIKAKLYELHKQNHYRYDPRLEILAIWVIFVVPVKKSLNPEDIV